MEKAFSRPKQFAEILDLTFHIIKDNFKNLFLIMLAFNTPIIILQVVIQLNAGRGLIRDVAAGESFIEQFINTYDMSDVIIDGSALTGSFIILLVELFIYPLAAASIYLIIRHIKNKESYNLKEIANQSFSRFWPLVGSYILYGIIAFLIIAIPLGIAVGLIFVSFGMGGILAGLFFILLSITVVIGSLLLLTRWSFYLPITLFDRAPGFSDSFRLTEGRTWMTFWLYVVLFLITTFIGTAIEGLSLILGMSVLYTFILSIVSVFTSLIMAVGTAVIYFDLEVRQTGSDLKDMIDQYQ